MAMGLLTGALVDAVMEKLVDVASTHVGDYFKRKWKGAEEELQRLKTLLPQIQSVVDAAERGEQQMSDQLRKWLWQLKDALYEADDVLDELDYLQLKQQAEAGDGLMSHARSKVIKFAKHIFKSDPTFDKLRRAVKKLGEVAAGVGPFVELLSNAQREFQQQETQTILNRETGPLLTENKVFGRDKERDELLRWLTGHEKENNMNVTLFSVVGHGGMGKTTLAQLVFNDKIVQDSFDLKIWVCVSTSFDVRGLTRSILESATKQRPDVDGLPALQDTLKVKLETSGKFLLILDDVWNDDNSSNWDKLLAPLKCGREGSKILLTTRMDQVADMAARAMGASTKGSLLKLGGLHGEDYSSLFNRYAFAGVDYGNYPNLQCIGMQIAKRLGSSPLAAKTVGGLLNSTLDDGYWTKILHSKNISDRVQHGEDNIMSILMLSYHHLPLHLRPCFAYCGMFPKDHYFVKENLVVMWVAVGLIQHSHQNQGEMLEDIGGYCFDELSRRSLFDHRYGDYYVMHDLLHDLAQTVSHGECFSFVDNDKREEDAIPDTVRHLYMEIGNLDVLPKMDNWHNLYSLALIINDYRPENFSALEKVLRSLKSIRMLFVYLGLKGLKTVTIPDAFNHLLHLRSFEFRADYLQQIPRSLCKLYHLQVLKFSPEKNTFKLPESMNKLVNLRHLSANETVAGVGNLISLRELVFSIRRESGYNIGELGDLICLRTLKIQGLENVKNQEEARPAKLSNKKYLQKLYLGWSISSHPGMDEHKLVLDHLQPHANLKKLKIEGYGGIMYPNWMGFEMINNLRHLCLSNCSRLDHLPPLGRLPYLEKFKLENIPTIKKLDFQCQRLKHLRIYEMEGLEELSEDAGQWHPYLDTLRIRYCPKLKVLPSLSLSVWKLCLDNLGLVTLPTLWLDCSNTCNTSDSSSSSLQVLKIKNCGKITSLGKGLLQPQHYLTALKKLFILNCPGLVDFPSGGLQHLRALKKLRIEDCPKLRVTLSGNDDKFLPSSLQSLWIGGRSELMPTLLKGIDSLDELTLMDCPELMSLDGFMGLRTVGRLHIRDCPNLAHTAGSDFTLAVNDLIIQDPLSSLVFLRSITSVRELWIDICGQLVSIDGELEQWLLKNQTTLKRIWICKARSLKSLPGCLKDLSSLESLKIYEANETLIERCKKDEGADWPTISHIPNFYITQKSWRDT